MLLHVTSTHLVEENPKVAIESRNEYEKSLEGKKHKIPANLMIENHIKRARLFTEDPVESNSQKGESVKFQQGKTVISRFLYVSLGKKSILSTFLCSDYQGNFSTEFYQ